MKRFGRFLLLFLVVMLALPMAVKADSYASSITFLNSVGYTFPIYDISAGRNARTIGGYPAMYPIGKFQVEGQTAFCVEPEILYQIGHVYPSKTTGEGARASLMSFGYGHQDLEKMQKIVSAGWNREQTSDMYQATQLLIWYILKPNGYTYISAGVQAKMAEIQSLLPLYDRAVSFNGQQVVLKGFGQEHGITLTDASGVFSQYNVNNLPAGLHAQKNGNDLTVWAEPSVRQGTISYSAPLPDGNGQASVYGSDRSQALAAFQSLPAPKGNVSVLVQIDPVLKEVSAQEKDEAKVQTEISVTKRDSQSKKPVSEVSFELFADEDSLGIFTTDGQGRIETSWEAEQSFVSESYTASYALNWDLLDANQQAQLKAQGVYENESQAAQAVNALAKNQVQQEKETFLNKIHMYSAQEVQTKAGYVQERAEDSQTLAGSGEVNFAFENRPVKGSLEIVKTGEKRIWHEGEAQTIAVNLADARFELKAAEDILDPADGSLLFAAGQVAAELQTNEDGFAFVSDLPLGKYQLTEVQAPTGYVLASESWNVDIVQEGSDASHVQLELENQRQMLQVRVTKADKADGFLLKGARFVLVDKQSQEVLLEQETDESGEILWEDLPLMEYEVREAQAPKGYALNESVYENKGSWDGPESLFEAALCVENEFIPIEVVLEKRDVRTQKAITGDTTVFSLIEKGKEEGSALVTSRKDGQVKFSLERPGTYILKEEKAPLGYVLSNAEMELEVSRDGVLRVDGKQRSDIHFCDEPLPIPTVQTGVFQTSPYLYGAGLLFAAFAFWQILKHSL